MKRLRDAYHDLMTATYSYECSGRLYNLMVFSVAFAALMGVDIASDGWKITVTKAVILLFFVGDFLPAIRSIRPAKAASETHD